MPMPHYLPPGPAAPDHSQLDAFFAAAKAANPDIDLGDRYDIRWIGMDHDSTEAILHLIRERSKIGTFTLPAIVERTDQPTPGPGLPIILIDFAGQPAVLVRLTTGFEEVAFGAIRQRHTDVDGPPVRPLDIWRPLHVDYWTKLLAPFGLTVSDDMPVWIEPFELLHSA